MKRIHVHGTDRQAGSALVIALISTVFLFGMAGALLAVGSASKKEHLAATDHMRSLYVAEAGLSQGVAAVMAGAAPVLGTSGNPIAFSSGSYWGTSAVDNVNRTTTVTVYGTNNLNTRGLEAVVKTSSNGVYANALFAGNSSGDPAYQMKFGGTGAQADAVNGNIYSGANIKIAGSATINGTARAAGTISGGPGETGVTQPIPDLIGMNYAVNNDVDVAQQFASGGATWANTTMPGYGGRAWQLPEANPAHIFRKNPDDRSSLTSGTTKDDYFLEDGYEPLNGSATIDPSGGSHITISGVGGEPGTNGNDLIYYIDGNLWVDNLNAYSFTLWNSSNTPIHVTFVVHGNIYISDNIFYNQPNQDALALIAMKDTSEPDSGNIYFGDPSFGTLEYMDAFMYAENDFLDNNMDALGSSRVTVHGNMTAGNQVLINRDFGYQHSKLTVNFDSRVWDHSVDLPGIPITNGTDPSYAVVSWREVTIR